MWTKLGRRSSASTKSEVRSVVDVKRYDNEPYIEYFVRLFEHKSEYGLTSESIASLLNRETGQNYGESAYRKEYAAFSRGRKYEIDRRENGVKCRALVISDLHCPFQKPISVFKDYIGRVDYLVLNGDILDCQAISKFTKTYRISPIEEMIGARNYLIELIETIKPKKVFVTYGNHDIRLGAYLAKNLDTDLQELMPETALDYIFIDGFTHYDRKTHSKIHYDAIKDVFDDVEIVYEGKWFVKIGDVVICHPRAFASNPMKTAEKAAIWFRNEGVSFNALIMAHTHRLGSYKIGATTIYEQGAACDTKKMLYGDGMLQNSQKEGFMYLCLDENGRNMEEHTKLIALN